MHPPATPSARRAPCRRTVCLGAYLYLALYPVNEYGLDGKVTLLSLIYRSAPRLRSPCVVGRMAECCNFRGGKLLHNDIYIAQCPIEQDGKYISVFWNRHQESCSFSDPTLHFGNNENNSDGDPEVALPRENPFLTTPNRTRQEIRVRVQVLSSDKVFRYCQEIFHFSTPKSPVYPTSF